MKITFKDVGQGDSIIIEWESSSKICYGLIDCNLVEGRNPTLDFLKAKSVSEIEFIVLSHFHYDHFSGMADVFQHFIDNNIRVKHFFHSLTPLVADIYNRIFTSQKIQSCISVFFEKYDAFDYLVDDKIPVSPHIAPLKLSDELYMSFLAPKGKIYDVMARQLSRKVNKITTTIADINKLSTIILIEEKDGNECLLISSDATRKAFKEIKSISNTTVLVQAPHHGSWPSIETRFWSVLKRIDKCPVVFSVGNVPRDRLPNVETVSFFDTQCYDVHSTNGVFGISEYFFPNAHTTPAKSKSRILNSFSTLKKVTSNISSSTKFSGDQVFQPFSKVKDL